ncbi:hypothetical protein BCON_0023g00290 [Botryotinia convoluta]|uniref:FAD-binding PCMH-type domain-containing protein n=1 Tax=Botryotinia convoluta TaxID=54673 RepID=A0A4Z1IK32_9HELO|nr:hypothetical protein BCON_0023g00290 [Botryotinia convoluta]
MPRTDQSIAQSCSALQGRIIDNVPFIDSLPSTNSTASMYARAKTACAVAKAIFPSNVVASNDSQYMREEEFNWSETCWLPASCFILVETTCDVIAALKMITYVGAKFAVRSGGYNPNAGFESIDSSGVLLDLRRLNSTSLLEGNEILQRGPGNTWGSLYDFLEGYNISVAGGRHSSVGVGGYLLGGGMSYFPNLMGLGADSIVNVEIVLANSSVITANSSFNSGIFFSIKGGGPNFGIVTRFDIHVHQTWRIWYSLNLYSPADYKQVLNATVQVQSAMEQDKKIGFFLNVNPTIIIAGLLYAEWTTSPTAFSPFSQLNSLGVYLPETNGTIASLAASINIGSTSARREPYAVTHGIDLDLYVQIQEEYISILESSVMPSANLSYTIQPMGISGINAGRVNGGNALGLVREPQSWHVGLVEWTSADDSNAAHLAVNSLGLGVRSLAKSKDAFLEYEFMNDASFTQNPLKSYGVDNMAKLQSTRQAYDPTGVFQNLQNSGFLLSRIIQS